jgi:hypothetical protein
MVEEVGEPSSVEVKGLRSFRFRPGCGVTKMSLGANAEYLATSADVFVSSPVLQEQSMTLEFDPLLQGQSTSLEF